MGLWEFIQSLPDDKRFVYIIFFASLILPGLGYIYLFNKELFQVEFIKLILMSIFFSFPILIIGILQYGIAKKTSGKIIKKLSKVAKAEEFKYFIYSISIFTLVISFIVFAFYFMNVYNTQNVLKTGKTWPWTWFKGNVYLYTCFIATILAFSKPVLNFINKYKKRILIILTIIIIVLLIIIAILIKIKKVNLF